MLYHYIAAEPHEERPEAEGLKGATPEPAAFIGGIIYGKYFIAYILRGLSHSHELTFILVHGGTEQGSQRGNKRAQGSHKPP